MLFLCLFGLTGNSGGVGDRMFCVLGFRAQGSGFLRSLAHGLGCWRSIVSNFRM